MKNPLKASDIMIQISEREGVTNGRDEDKTGRLGDINAIEMTP